MSQDISGTTDDPRTKRLYHGTRADLSPGDSIEPGDSPYIYLTPDLDAAIWEAEIADEDDPNLTDKKFRGHPPERIQAMKDGLAKLEREGIRPIDD